MSPEAASPIADALWPVQAGGALVAGALLVLLARLVAGAVACARTQRGGLERALPLASVVAGVILRLTLTPTTALWYSPVSPRSSMTLNPGVTAALVWARALVPGVAPFSWLAAAVWIAGVGCAWHAYFLAGEIGAPRPLAFLVSLGFALWPQFVRASTTDAPHVLALLFWFVAARALVPGGAPGGRRALSWAAALVLLTAMPFVSRETIAWPIAAVALRPRSREPDPVERTAAVLLVVVPLVAGWAITGGRPFWNPGSNTWMFTPLGPLLLFYGASTTLPGAVAMLAVAALGVADLARRRPALLRPLVAVMAAPLLPMLIGAHSPANRLAMRYDLPCELGVFALVGAGLLRLWILPRWRVKAAIALALACALFAEWRGGLSTGAQEVRRAEFDFLRRTLASLPAGARMCVVDPRASQTWPEGGRHRDLTMSYSPDVVEGAAGETPWYLGRPDVVLVSWDPAPDALDARPAGGCGYFFEGSICHLAGDADDPIASPYEARRFRDVCERAHRALSLEETAAAFAPAPTFMTSRFAPSPVPLRVYRVIGPEAP